MTERIEESILRNLICNEQYYRKVVPFIKADYFQEYNEKILFEEIADFAAKYDKVPLKKFSQLISRAEEILQKKHSKIHYRD